MCFRNRKEMAKVVINIARHWKFQKFVKSRQKFSPKLNLPSSLILSQQISNQLQIAPKLPAMGQPWCSLAPTSQMALKQPTLH